MEKLELKHLAPYLPYGLKIQCKRIHFKEYWVSTLKSIYYDSLDVVSDESVLSEGEYKPILRPLSDLTNNVFSDTAFSIESNESIDSIYMSYREPSMGDFVCGFNELLENHFDVFGLIEKGLAIDVNTLDINPYK